MRDLVKGRVSSFAEIAEREGKVERHHHEDYHRAGRESVAVDARLRPAQGRRALGRVGASREAYISHFGYTPPAIINNMGLLKVDPSKVQALIVSHGHSDH
jgi:hypothetical protein